MSKPTVLFVHGAWHTPNHFAPVRRVFEEAGFPTSCPRLPSVGNAPPIGLMEDAQCIRDELVRLIEGEERDIVVVAHSYGGVVATQAVEQRFAKKTCEKEGKKGGVVRIVYMCAFLMNVGEPLPGASGGSLAPFMLADVRHLGLETTLSYSKVAVLLRSPLTW
jgi:pimeloyl-ACP methyl ester carboxylesterase